MGDVLKGDPMSRDFSDISNKQYLSLLDNTLNIWMHHPKEMPMYQPHSLLDNAPNHLNECIIQKRLPPFDTT